MVLRGMGLPSEPDQNEMPASKWCLHAPSSVLPLRDCKPFEYSPPNFPGCYARSRVAVRASRAQEVIPVFKMK